MRHQDVRVALAVTVLIGGVLAVAGGCRKEGPVLGLVQGVVTLDGQPLAHAVVEFQPVDEERSSYDGQTDKHGRYKLHASVSRKGAELGEYTVHITRPKRGSDSAAHPPPTIPAKYNRQTELKATVKKGKNTFNFALASK